MVVEQKSMRFKRQCSAWCTPSNRDIQPSPPKKKNLPPPHPLSNHPNS